MSETARWTPVPTADGSITFASPRHGQLCHSKAGAWTETKERYVDPCRIVRRCKEFAARGESLRLLDLGTGAGWNVVGALWALEQARAVDPRSALEIWTFEESLGVLQAALAAPTDQVPREAASAHATWIALLRDLLGPSGSSPEASSDREVPFQVRRPGLVLNLLLGDARRTLAKIPRDLLFDACFFDAFSPGVDPPLWESGFLRAVGERLAPGALLSTYTASLEIRARLVHDAGLQVGRGPRACGKSQGTLATRSPEPPPEPFDPRTARKLAARVARKAAGP